MQRLCTIDQNRYSMTLPQADLRLFDDILFSFARQRNPDEFLRRFISADEAWIHF